MSSLLVREATAADLSVLARMNAELITDEGHHNPMNVNQLHERMRNWLESGEYSAQIFAVAAGTAGYCLFKKEPRHIYLRQFFIEREFRRRGLGREALTALCNNLWQGRRLRVEVLSHNAAGLAFWKSCGFGEYALTLERLIPGESVIQRMRK